MNRIDIEILNIDKVICRNIDRFDASDRGLLSQNILSQLRNFVEHISLKALGNGQDIENSYANIQKANDHVKSRGNLKFLSKFHRLLLITASHFTLDEENSERLMLKYYEYLLKIKTFLNSKYNLDVLKNIDEAFNNLYFNKTNMLEVIKGNIAEVIGLPDASLDEVEARLEELQRELLKKANSKQNYDDLAQNIFDLREKKQQILVEAAGQDGYKKRITELEEYLENFNQEQADYDEQLVRSYIEKITVYDDRYDVEFKAGFKLNIIDNIAGETPYVGGSCFFVVHEKFQVLLSKYRF